MTSISEGPGPLQITNTRKVRDHLRVDMDADGKVFMELEAGGHSIVFYLSKKAIKALRDACPDAPVMLLTGAVHNLSRSPNYGGLVDAFVAKPCTLAELLDTVERLLAA